AASKGKFVGYVKPVIKDLDVVGHEDRNDNLFRKMWEVMVGAAGVVLRNQKEGQIAAKVPIEGTFKDQTITHTWYAIVDLLRNAFIQALIPSIDNAINIRSINSKQPEDKGFFKHLFGKKKNEKNALNGKMKLVPGNKS